MLTKTINTKSSLETYDLGKNLGEALGFPLVIFLRGEMGAGKTVFAKGFVKGMGIDDEVTSPTYTIVNEYGDPPRVFHFDLYRLQDGGELYEMGFEDYLNQEGTLILEWPDLLLNDLFEHKLEITLKSDFHSPDEREIILETSDAKIEHLLSGF